jgi:thiol:disulfide interchange protein DsbC
MVAKRMLMLLALGAGAAIAAQQGSPQQGATQTGATQTGSTPAQTPQGAAKGDPRAEIASHIPGARADELHPSPVPGIYELARGADIIYVTADGKYAFSGDLYELANKNNLTEEHRRELRVKQIAAFPESEMVIFGPPSPKYTVTVFTDVDCPFCRKLHSQIAEYNRLGVRVRYLLYPRNGPNTSSWTKAEQVWCSADRNDALTRAKLGQDLKIKVCANNPVARSYALGQEFALQGTPAIILPDGQMVPGYLSPEELLQELKGGGGS